MYIFLFSAQELDDNVAVGDVTTIRFTNVLNKGVFEAEFNRFKELNLKYRSTYYPDVGFDVIDYCGPIDLGENQASVYVILYRNRVVQTMHEFLKAQPTHIVSGAQVNRLDIISICFFAMTMVCVVNNICIFSFLKIVKLLHITAGDNYIIYSIIQPQLETMAEAHDQGKILNLNIDCLVAIDSTKKVVSAYSGHSKISRIPSRFSKSPERTTVFPIMKEYVSGMMPIIFSMYCA